MPDRSHQKRSQERSEWGQKTRGSLKALVAEEGVEQVLAASS